MKKLLLLLFFCACFLGVYAQTSWELSGNAGTIATRHFLGTTDNMPLIFKTNGVEQMRLLPTGWLGLGTEQPQAVFHLHNPVGQIHTPNVPLPLMKITFPNKNNGFNIFGFLNTGNISLGLNEQANFSIYGYQSELTFVQNGNIVANMPINAKFGVAGAFSSQSASIADTLTANVLSSQNVNISGTLTTNKLSINGNLGLGTNTPQQKLHIKDGNILISKIFPTNNGLEKGSITFGFEQNPNGPQSNLSKWGIEHVNSSTDEYGLNFWKYGYDNSTQPPPVDGDNSRGWEYNSVMFFNNSNNNVGIGTKNPQNKLDVEGSFGAWSADISGALNAQSANIDGKLTAQSATITTLSINKLNVPSINLDTVITKVLKAQTATVTGNTHLNGNVGIGANNPLTKMQIGDIWTFHDGSANKIIGRNSYWNGSNYVRIKQDFSSQLYFGSTGEIVLQTAPTGDAGTTITGWNSVTLTNDGNVGIGITPSQQTKLDVNGLLKAQSANITGNATVNSGISTLSLGSAYSSALSYGTSYVGFNAVRDNGTWTLAGDGANNGGAVIWNTVGGTINFASIPRSSSNSGSTQTLTDVDIKNNIKLQLTATGNVGIGISNPTVKLDVNGIIRAHEVKVCLNQGCDYVFEEDYNLMNLSDLNNFIKTNKHLPDVAPAVEMEAEGINLSEMNALLLRKIEELTLYILDLQKQINELKKQTK